MRTATISIIAFLLVTSCATTQKVAKTGGETTGVAIAGAGAVSRPIGVVTAVILAPVYWAWLAAYRLAGGESDLF
jgi:hypothetical protein